ncbi:MAG: type II toxin-antitoxin system MqsA family antitoxin [Acidobacteria bacterium]|nr:type II toxin-antitoxin system MqsA family antitoxin [Acidobacteriota bacterium]
MKRARCPQCGSLEWKQFKGETFKIAHRGLTANEKGLAGWLCGACGEVVFDKGSAQRYSAAGDKLVLAARAGEQAEIRRIRRKLGLTQAMAAQIMGGGHNAFSRYERGEAAPVPAVMNLLRILDRHPELLRELTGVPRVP